MEADQWERFRQRRDELRRHRRNPCRLDNPVEFDRLVAHLRQSRVYCGSGHAEAVARGFAGQLGWHADDLLRAAARPG